MKTKFNKFIYTGHPDPNENLIGPPHEHVFVRFPRARVQLQCSNILNKEPHSIPIGERYRNRVIQRGSIRMKPTFTCIACVDEWITLGRFRMKASERKYAGKT